MEIFIKVSKISYPRVDKISVQTNVRAIITVQVMYNVLKLIYCITITNYSSTEIAPSMN